MQLLRGLTLLAAGFALLAAGYAAYRQDLTTDEPHHLAWSRRLWEQRETERLSELHFNSKTPVIVPHVVTRQLARRAFDVREPEWLRFWARLPTVVELGVLLAAIFLLTRRFVDERAAYLATLGAALDPNLIAHGSLATVDVPYALATLLTLSAGVAFASAPTVARGVLLGAAFAFALTTKFSALLLLPGLALGVGLSGPLRRAALARTRPMLLGLLAGAVTCCVLLCAAYGFVEVGAALREWDWKSRAFGALARHAPWLRLPVPRDLLTGIDLTMAGERKPWPVVVLGGLHPFGVWYYFAVVWAVKTPLLVALVTLYGGWRAVRAGVFSAHPWLLVLAVSLAFNLAYFSFLFHTQVGYRFVLMCVPLALIVAASGLSRVDVPRAALVLVAAVALLENAPYVGNPISFTNAAVWPKEQAFRLVADSNLDWGQNDDKLDAFLAREGRTRTLHVEPVHVMPGRNVLSVNVAAGVANWKRHEWVRTHLDPAGHFRHTYLFFDVDAATYERFLSGARRYAPNDRHASACPAADASRPLAPVAPISVNPTVGPQQAEIVCLRVAEPTELALRVTSGRATFGRVDWRRRDWDAFGPGYEAHYRLEPGLHVFGFTGAPGLAGTWSVTREVRVARGRLADFQTRPGVAQGYLFWREGNAAPVPSAHVAHAD